MSPLLRISRIHRSSSITLLLTFIVVVSSLPLGAQSFKFTVKGVAYLGEGMFGSGAQGGPFNYWSAWPDAGSDLGVICQAGQVCNIDLPVQFYYLPDPDKTWACVNSTCTWYISGSVKVSTLSFITPKIPEYGQTQVSGPVTVSGSVSGSYSNWEGAGGNWELWNASFSGRGRETVTLYGYGGGAYLALYAEAHYTGSGSAALGISEIPTPAVGTSGVAYDNDSLFVSQPGAFGTISQLSIPKGTVLNTFLTPSTNGFDGRSNPSDLAVGDHHLFMSDVGAPGSAGLYEFDSTGNTVYNHFALPFRGGAVGYGGKRLFVADLDTGLVEILSRSGQLLSSFTLPFSSAGMVFDFQRNWLWVLSQEDSMYVWQFSTKGTPIGYCVGPWNPGIDGVGGIGIDARNRLYIAEVGKFQLDYPQSVVSAVEATGLGCYPSIPQGVPLSIQPGIATKAIDPNSSGTVSASVLSRNQFDAATIDPSTVHFGETGQEAVPLDWVLQDVNGDGRNDLLLHFRISDIGISCWTNVVSVTGRTFGGGSVRGSQSIITRNCKQ